MIGDVEVATGSKGLCMQGGSGTWILNTGWEGGGVRPKAEKKNSDLIYFCRKLGCRTLNASAVAINVLRLSRYPFI